MIRASGSVVEARAGVADRFRAFAAAIAGSCASAASTRASRSCAARCWAAASRLAGYMFSPLTSRTTSVRQLGLFLQVVKVPPNGAGRGTA